MNRRADHGTLVRFNMYRAKLNRRRAALCAGLFLTAFAMGGTAMAEESLAPGHHLLSTQASERATGGMGNKIVTIGERTHVVWQDVAKDGYWARVRTLDRRTGAWSETITLGKGVDNHARPCIAADADGYLHVVIGGHNTPFQYRRSVRPNDSSEWTKTVSFGKGTYPFVACGPGNALYLTARGTHNGVDLYSKEPEGKWTVRLPLLVKREPQYQGYAGYNTILAWGPGQKRLHFACDVYEGHGTYERRGENQLVVYLASDDFGRTWKKADGSPIEGERYPKNLDVIAVSSRKREQKMPAPVLRLGGLVVDTQDRPSVLYASDEPERGRGRVVTPAQGGGWDDLGLAVALDAHAPGWGVLGPRAAFSIAADGLLQMCLPLAPLADFGAPGAPQIKPENVRYVWVETADGGKTWRFREPVPRGDGLQRHHPTLERPTGGNSVPAGRTAAMMYFEGLQRYAEKDEVIQNRLYFVEVR